VVKLRVENSRLSPVTMEPRRHRPCRGDDQYTLYLTSQNPQRAHGNVARLSRAGEPDRVVSPDVGGGFGLKACFPTMRSRCGRRAASAAR
jgi:CO/xanthine dehydrogenase Mo-binding subunit